MRNFFPFVARSKAFSHSSKVIRPLPFRSIRENRPRAGIAPGDTASEATSRGPHS